MTDGLPCVIGPPAGRLLMPFRQPAEHIENRCFIKRQ